MLKYWYCVLRTSDYNFDLRIIERALFQNVGSTQLILFAVHKVWAKLAVKLANYNDFSGLAMEDASKGFMLLKGIVDKGSAPCSAKYISDRDYLSSIILYKYIVCDICRLRSTHFRLLHLTCGLLYTIRDILMTVEIYCLYRLLWKDLSL